jgi:glycosyltransferase involved in cell wall biosynthesis
MKLSVLLPTRNGGLLLEDCVRSVLEQDFSDLELIVSDNASADETQSILDGFRGDPRLQVLRLEEPVPVTENWNRALDASSGDYLLLIGDDDYLMPRFCERAEALLREHDSPDVLSYNAYAFAFPGALHDRDAAHYADPLFRGDPELPIEDSLPRPKRAQLVQDFFRFQFGFCLNMQTTLVSRRAVQALPNGLFHAPFPDFYAVNALLLTADTWIHTDERLVIVGISPKSFGSTFQGAEQQRGLPYLGISTDFSGQLPGHEMINGTYLCAQQLKRDFAEELRGVEISRADYVYIQLSFWFLQWRLGALSKRDLVRLGRRLSPRDWRLALRMLAGRANLDMLRRNARLDRSGATIQMWPGLVPAPEVTTVAELADRLAREKTSV